MSDDLQPSVVSKKRDASSPLQNPSDSYKRTKQAQQASEKLLSDINDSYTAVDEMYIRLILLRYLTSLTPMIL